MPSSIRRRKAKRAPKSELQICFFGAFFPKKGSCVNKSPSFIAPSKKHIMPQLTLKNGCSRVTFR